MPEYKIVNPGGNSKLFITALTASVNTDNDLVVRWTWPEDPLQQVALIFETESPRASLDELLAKQTPKNVYRNLSSSYSERLLKSRTMFKLYPAGIDTKNGVVYVTEQTEGNTTQYLMRKIRVKYDIKYKLVPLSGYKYASLSIDALAAKTCDGLGDDMLSVKKINKRTNAYICQYPVATGQARADDSPLTYIIKNDELLVLNVRNEYKDVIELRPERS